MSAKTKSAQVIYLNAPRNAAHAAKHTTEGPGLASLYIINGNGCKHYPDKLQTWKIADALFYVLSNHFECTEGTPQLSPYSAARLNATLQQAATDLENRTIVDLQIVFAERGEDDEIGMRVFGATVAPTVADTYYQSTLVLAIGPRGEVSQRLVQPTVNAAMRRNQGFGGRRHVLH